MSTSGQPSSRIALVEQIEAILPQTQCGKCQHPGCRPYAEAIADGEAINHCVPGGHETIEELATLLNTPALPLDPAYGVEQPFRMVAVIREAECIGCTKCIQACPVDAIIGAAKFMHTVITADCTGCDLCLPPCPVDCIDMVELPRLSREEQKVQAVISKQRYESKQSRLKHDAEEKLKKKAPAPVTIAAATDTPAKPTGAALMIAAALARTNLKKAEKRLEQAIAANEPTAEIEADILVLKAELERLS